MNGEVTDAALNWWASIRPAAYTLEDHLNCGETKPESEMCADRRACSLF